MSLAADSEGPDQLSPPEDTFLHGAIQIQLTPVISTSLISNNRLSRSENLVPS